jgi:hypothetical protein
MGNQGNRYLGKDSNRVLLENKSKALSPEPTRSLL